MKLSEVRPCDHCGNPLAPQAMFYVVRVSLAIVHPVAFRQTVGTALIVGSVKIAEALSPDSDVIKIVGDEKPELMTELLLCQNCYTLKDVSLAQLSEQRTTARQSADN